MNKSSATNYFFRKSPLLRALVWVVLILAFVSVSVILRLKVRQYPEISEISPQIGSPGDLVVIKGKNFGAVKDSGYVDFGGSRLTSSSYLSWHDDEIKVILPPGVQGGLVFVGVKDLKSKPAFFVNSASVPIVVAENTKFTVPIVTGLSPEHILPGSLITISGSNFGNFRDMSNVYFSADRENLDREDGEGSESLEYVAADSGDFDYEYWSDSEIRVRIPDGAVSGKFYVKTPRGKSALRNIKIDGKAGKKSLVNPKIYVVQLSCDLEDYSGEKNSSIILRIPRPATSVYQPSARLIEANPEPIIPDFQNTVIHQVQGGRNLSGRRRFSQNFAVTVYETRTSVFPDNIDSLKNVNKLLVGNATFPDSVVPSENESVKALLSQIIKKETNPYKIALLCYNHMILNYRILHGLRADPSSPLDMLSSKKGDAYDFTIVYTALLRAAGIPALPDSGFLVNSDLRTRNHWWTEVYLPGFGWFPVDVALGAGLDYRTWARDIVPSEFYFGNLDSQHILVSRGFNEIKSASPENKTVARLRTYALQSVWEESSGRAIKYTSYWANPIVLGVY